MAEVLPLTSVSRIHLTIQHDLKVGNLKERNFYIVKIN